MSTVEEIKRAILDIPPDQRRVVAEWHAEQDSEDWDRQIEADARAGKLDQLAAEAVADIRVGRGRAI